MGNCNLTYDLDMLFMGTNLFAKDDKVVCRELVFNPNYEQPVVLTRYKVKLS